MKVSTACFIRIGSISGSFTNYDSGYISQFTSDSANIHTITGSQAEYTFGQGPEFNKVTDSIEVMPLKGGYVTLTYLAKFNQQIFIPFIRYQYYDGGKKHERDARSYIVKEFEIGGEWQVNKNFELVVNYTISKRRYEDFVKQDNYQTGNLLRIQAQVNF